VSTAAIAKVVTADGWELRVVDDEEPRILDLDLATRLGFKRREKVRDLIKSLVITGKLNAGAVFTAPGKTSEKGGRPAIQHWLSEAGALKVIAKSETKKADAILDEVIDVYIKVRRGLMPHATPNVVLPTESATTTRTGDVPLVRNTISMLCKLVAKSTGRPLQAIHGYVRKTFRTVGIHQLPIGLWPACEKTLNALAMGTLILPPRARAPLRLIEGGAAQQPPKQQTLPGMEG